MVMEAAVRESETPEKPRPKTPLFLLGGAAVVAGVVILSGLKSGMQPEIQAVKEVTKQGASVEGSSMARLLEQQRRDAQEVERVQAQARAQGMATAPGAANPWGAAPTGGSAIPDSKNSGGPPTAYIEPTGSVPKYAFAGSGKCDELPTLEERLKCLDGQFVYETRSVRLKELGDTMTADDNLFMGEGDSADDGTAERGGSRSEGVPAWLPFRSLDGFDESGRAPDRARSRGGDDRASQDPSARFHRTGGAEFDPDRKTSEQKTAPSRYWLRSGSILPCAFISGVTSQLPGQAEAQITQNVYDSIDHRHLLIPAGSLLVGRPNPETGQGQDRIQFAWTELHLPDGEFRELGGMAGADGAGMAGVEGKVNRHWGRKLGLALMTTSLNVSFHLAAPSPRAGTPQDAVAQGVGEGVVQLATENLRKMMQIPDEIVIKPGQTCSVKVERSLEFPRAYSDGKRWRR